MRVREKNILTGAYKDRKHIRNDEGLIIGLDENIRIYKILESDRPALPDYRTHQVVKHENYTEPNPYNALGLYEVTYTVEQLSNDDIIRNLSNSVGEHLDSLYPEWERSKHAGESLRFVIKGQENWTSDDLQRINYIQSTADWCRSCRELRDQKENELLTNGTLPDFIWPERPAKI